MSATAFAWPGSPETAIGDGFARNGTVRGGEGSAEAAWSVEGGPGAGPACHCRRRPERSGELKRLAMAQLERGHWRARARIGQHHTYKAVAAETEAGHVYGRADVEAHRAALGMQAVERQEREAARPPPASTDARSRPEPRPRGGLGALIFP